MISYKIQPSLIKQVMEHDKIHEDTWEARENEWLRYVKNDVFSTAYCFARYIMGMEELTHFGMTNNLTLLSLAIKFSISLRDGNDESVYTYTDPFMRKCVCNSKKGGRCNAFI